MYHGKYKIVTMSVPAKYRMYNKRHRELSLWDFGALWTTCLQN